jgi:hypothetical protein
MSTTMAEIGPYLALILFGFLPDEFWRVLGLVLVRGLDEHSQIVLWVRAVATAMLAAVLAQLILASSGALAAIPVAIRVGAAVAGFAAFVIGRRSVFAGVLTGEVVLLGGAYAYGV